VGFILGRGGEGEELLGGRNKALSGLSPVSLRRQLESVSVWCQEERSIIPRRCVLGYCMLVQLDASCSFIISVLSIRDTFGSL
jgi:hypothetical protein